MNAVLPMAPLASTRPFQAALAGALFALGVFIPWSTAGTSIALGALALLYAATARESFRQTPWREPVVAVGLALLAYIFLRSAAATGFAPETTRVANHYHELLMVPLLVALMRIVERRNIFLLGLLAGSLALAVAHWLPLGDVVTLKLQMRRISVGFGLSVCAFVCYEETRLGRLPRLPGYAASAFLAATVLFATGARTGYVVLLLLAVCAAWRTAPKRWRWPVLGALLVAAVLAATLLSTVRERRGDIAVSNKIRTEFLHHSMDVVSGNWLVGTGWAGYRAAYEEAAAQRGTARDALWARSDNPHNEYLMQAAGGGLPALALFLAWLAVPIFAPLRRHEGTNSQTGVLACIALAFALGCVFNSMLLDFIEAHLYGALMAWLLAQRE